MTAGSCSHPGTSIVHNRFLSFTNLKKLRIRDNQRFRIFIANVQESYVEIIPNRENDLRKKETDIVVTKHFNLLK